MAILVEWQTIAVDVVLRAYEPSCTRHRDDHPSTAGAVHVAKVLPGAGGVDAAGRATEEVPLVPPPAAADPGAPWIVGAGARGGLHPVVGVRIDDAGSAAQAPHGLAN